MVSLNSDTTWSIRSIWLGKAVCGKNFDVLLHFVLVTAFILYFEFAGASNGQSLGAFIRAFAPFFVIIFIVALGRIVSLYLRKVNFHFLLQLEYLVVSQGVIKRSERIIPFATIQDVQIIQDSYDRVFHLYTVIIESAAPLSRAAQREERQEYSILASPGQQRNRRRRILLGSVENKVYFPGLSQSDADQLKVCVLARMKQFGISPGDP